MLDVFAGVLNVAAETAGGVTRREEEGRKQRKRQGDERGSM